jgi:DnaJ-class molecular chaperone
MDIAIWFLVVLGVAGSISLLIDRRGVERFSPRRCVVCLGTGKGTRNEPCEACNGMGLGR